MSKIWNFYLSRAFFQAINAPKLVSSPCGSSRRSPRTPSADGVWGREHLRRLDLGASILRPPPNKTPAHGYARSSLGLVLDLEALSFGLSLERLVLNPSLQNAFSLMTQLLTSYWALSGLIGPFNLAPEIT